MNIELSRPNRLIISVQDNDGFLPNQPLEEQLFGQRDLSLLCLYHGRELVDILFDDHGLISYHDNKLALATILTVDNTAIMRIMGKVAESIIVRRSYKSIPLNRMWMRLGSGTNVQIETARKYRAVGTGFKSTQIHYPTVYNPHDTQRDIIWLDDNNYRYPIHGSSSSAARDAGLQVKISTNGMNYIYNDLLNGTYEVPVVYFDLSADYGRIYNRLRSELPKQEADLLRDRFLSVREYDEDAYYEAEYYLELVQAVANGRLRIDDLVNRAERYPTFGSAIMASAMQTVAGRTILEASHDESPLLRM